ncbi:MAG: gephyrin-like molybdotransferase Glp [Granulosicoccaceae bacterium]
MTIEKQPSCDDPIEPALLPVTEARRRMALAVSPINDAESVHLSASLARVLANDIHSPRAVPPQCNSAMDGFAISRDSIPSSGEATLELIDTAWAGRPCEQTVRQGQAIRIFTGAIMPAGADTVVIQEHAMQVGDTVRIDAEVQAGKNVRPAGEDVQKGECVLCAGTTVGAAEIGVLASLGIDTVDVVRKIRVAFFSTGDELRALDEHAGTELPLGMLFDSNRHTLKALLASPAIDIIDMGVVPDDVDKTRSALLSAAKQADLVVTSGGISAGEADFVAQVFQEQGRVSFWKLAMRPGRPLAFGHVEDAVFFGLPGNPVAVVVTYLQFVKPAIKRLQGAVRVEPIILPAISTSAMRKTPGRTEFQRGMLSVGDDGQLKVASTGKQGAGRLTSVAQADCLIVLEPTRGKVEPGDTVRVQPFFGLLA